ncbi:3'-5' exonuclease family protein [Aliterella atlantica]|uniref:Exonuclease n=1 Tax=Aliterella atlantica CENA595 TaxID=1618023 RepID=A0A0D8ZN62_9CYAN|nr:exonuclease [Aliterella atlantica]KJH69914.1 exonuclease [Aliterella atlantica CENA595]
MQEIYVSTDVETDGPIPGINSMLSFASAAYLPDKTLVSTFSANLETLPEAKSDPQTMEWWKTQPEAWSACRQNLQAPDLAMPKYVQWLESLPGKPVFVAYPAAFDFMFVYWYLIRFAGKSPFSHSALDIKTLAMALLKTGYRDATKRRMPRHWFDNLPHTHISLDDAIEQGALFCNMLQELHRP